MKGRAVLLGDSAKDQDFNWAEICEPGSSPPSMEAAKALDAMGSLLGHVVKTGDAREALRSAIPEGCRDVGDVARKSVAEPFEKEVSAASSALRVSYLRLR